MTVDQCIRSDRAIGRWKQEADRGTPVHLPEMVCLDLSSDCGILNYLYALKQVVRAFYDLVCAESYTERADSDNERKMLYALRNHERAHAEALQTGIVAGGGTLNLDLEVDFRLVDIWDRVSVLTLAQRLEDLSVSAYNGIAPFLKDNGAVSLVLSIVSVEARHASAIRGVLHGSDSFAGAVDASGLGAAATPSQVLASVKPFIATPISLVSAHV